MKSYIFCFLLLPCLLVKAQLIRFTPDNISSDDRIFLPGFIKENKIQNATIEFSRKEENERIENLLKRWIYYFDEEGRIAKLVKIDHPNYVNPDTTWIYSYYNASGNLRIRRTVRNTIYEGEYYEYNDSGYVTKLAVTRENNFGNTAEDFKPAQQNILFLETYSYEKLSSTQLKVRIKNDQGSIYREGILYYDKSYLIEKDLRYTITGIRHNEKYLYDDKSRIKEYIYFTDAAGELTEKKAVTYDDVSGNLKTVDHYRNGEHTNQVFYFYDKKNLLIEGEVNKELKTGVLLLRNYKFNSLQESPSPSRR